MKRWAWLALLLGACERAPAPRGDIAREYPAEVTALDTQGGPGLPYLVGKDLRPVWNTQGAPAVRQLAKFRMTDQLGQEVDSEKLRGKIAVVSFFFTQCQGICPMTTRNLKTLQEKFRGDDRFVILSFSITPTIDDTKTLRKFARTNQIDARRWRLMTGERDAIYALARDSFGADTFSPAENAEMKLKPEDFLHSENVYLLDGEQKLRGVYTGRMVASVQDLARDAQTLLR